MFTALGIYADSFEKPFLERTSEFYAAEGVKYMQQSDVPDYLRHVEVTFFYIFVFTPANILHVEMDRHVSNDGYLFSYRQGCMKKMKDVYSTWMLLQGSP